MGVRYNTYPPPQCDGIVSALDARATEPLPASAGRRSPTSSTAGKGKRGTAPRLQQQLEQIEQLPKAKQRFVIEMLDTVIQQQAS